MRQLRVDLDDVLRPGGIRAVYQPIVELDGGRTVGFEALARGPEGSPMESPMAMLLAASSACRSTELDWACRAAAVRGALDAGVRRPQALFVNVEPSAIASAVPEALVELVEQAERDLRIVVEITERALRVDPAAILAAVAWVRGRGWEIALDDVGAEQESLAYLPFLQPDVVKLDMSLLHRFGDAAPGAVSDAVAAERERRDLVVLAEGIESEDHLDTARVLGATHGQGWFFGRPSAVPIAVNGVATLPLPGAHAPPDVRTPIELIAEHCPLGIAEKRLLMPMSRHLERRLERDPDPAVLVGTFQHAEHFTAATARRFGGYAARSPFVAAFGANLGPQPAPGVRGAHIEPADPLSRHWIVAVLGPHYAGALVAHDLLDDGVADERRRFRYAITHRREIVSPIVGMLMERVVAETSHENPFHTSA